MKVAATNKDEIEAVWKFFRHMERLVEEQEYWDESDDTEPEPVNGDDLACEILANEFERISCVWNRVIFNLLALYDNVVDHESSTLDVNADIRRAVEFYQQNHSEEREGP